MMVWMISFQRPYFVGNSSWNMLQKTEFTKMFLKVIYMQASLNDLYLTFESIMFFDFSGFLFPVSNTQCGRKNIWACFDEHSWGQKWKEIQ